MFYCVSCKKEKDFLEIALNEDGTGSMSCILCKKKEKNRYDKQRSDLKAIRLEFIKKYQSCCYLCNNISF